MKDICHLEKGKQIDTDRLDNSNPYKYINGGIEASGYYNDYNTTGQTITVSEGGASCGYVNYVEEPFWCGCHCYRLTDIKTNPKYLYYAIKANQRRIMELRTGSAMPNIKKSTFEEFEITIDGSTQVQESIVKTLELVTRLIDQRHKQLASLDTLVKARFAELFGDPVINTSGWEQAKLCDVTSKIGSGATPRGGKESYQADGITLIRSMNVHDGRFEHKDLAHITDAQATQLDNVTVEEHDVFINITGASVARSCIVPSTVLPARVNQHVAIIRCIQSRLNPTFANSMFLNDRFKGQLLDIGESGGATRQAITKQQLEMLTVILPPMELQEQFAAIVAQTNKSKFLCGTTGKHMQFAIQCIWENLQRGHRHEQF